MFSHLTNGFFVFFVGFLWSASETATQELPVPTNESQQTTKTSVQPTDHVHHADEQHGGEPHPHTEDHAAELPAALLRDSNHSQHLQGSSFVWTTFCMFCLFLFHTYSC